MKSLRCYDHLAEMLQAGASAIVHLSGERILIPSKADVSCKYETGEASRELSIRVTWDAASSDSVLKSLEWQ